MVAALLPSGMEAILRESGIGEIWRGVGCTRGQTVDDTMESLRVEIARDEACRHFQTVKCTRENGGPA
jgi:hypothetical protein